MKLFLVILMFSSVGMAKTDLAAAKSAFVMFGLGDEKPREQKFLNDGSPAAFMSSNGKYMCGIGFESSYEVSLVCQTEYEKNKFTETTLKVDCTNERPQIVKLKAKPKDEKFFVVIGCGNKEKI